jgi:cell division protein FtsB
MPFVSTRHALQRQIALASAAVERTEAELESLRARRKVLDGQMQDLDHLRREIERHLANNRIEARSATAPLRTETLR